ncbi:MAG: aminotransferase class I/II-fold pyridoxal phosphate-dependent enzyme [candidate division WOR-3 bacterium]
MNELEPVNYGPWLICGKKRVLNLSGGDILGLWYEEDFKSFISESIEKSCLFSKTPYQEFGTVFLSIPKDFLDLKKQEAGILGKTIENLLISLLEVKLPGSPLILVDEQLDPGLKAIISFNTKFTQFSHNSLSKLEELLTSKEIRNPIIVTQTFFPFSSEFCPLAEIVELCKRHEGILVVLESWAEVLPDMEGRSFSSILSSPGSCKVVILGDFSYFLPFSVSYLLSNNQLIEQLKEESSVLKNSLQPSIFQVRLIEWFAQKLKSDGKELKRKLNDNANYLRYELFSKGFRTLGEFSPFIPILVGGKDTAKEFKGLLLEESVLVNEISYPLVPVEKARILLIPSVLHTKDDLDFALQKFVEVGKYLNLI